MLDTSLEQKTQHHHVVYAAFAVGVVREHRHEGEEQAHEAVLQDEGADGDLAVGHVAGLTVL